MYAHRWERRVIFTGPLTGQALRAAYERADVVVLPSRSESYGMVVAEALAHGVPVVATRVGGVPEALGRAPGGALPGLLVPPDDPTALADALARWIDEPDLRDRLRRAAAARRPALPGWAAAGAPLRRPGRRRRPSWCRRRERSPVKPGAGPGCVPWAVFLGGRAGLVSGLPHTRPDVGDLGGVTHG